MRQLTSLDRLINRVDRGIRALFPPKPHQIQRPSPGEKHAQAKLTQREQKHIIGLMRVNHAGEICAQALYQGQAFTAKGDQIREQMHTAAQEELDHLAWCEQRLMALGSGPSLLNPLWYLGSFALGSLAGLIGDRVSLGFVAETERQVAAHLQSHLKQLPAHDNQTKAILEQMLEDETAHAEKAEQAGAAELPMPITQAMRWMSRLMTRSSYYL